MILQSAGKNVTVYGYSGLPHVQTLADKFSTFQNNFTEVLFALIVAYVVITVAKEICQCATHHSNNDLKATELEFEDDAE